MEGMTVLNNNIIGGKVQAIHAHKTGVAIHNDRVAAYMMSSNLFDKSSIEVLEPILHLPPTVSFVATTGHNVNIYGITQLSCFYICGLCI